MPRVIDSVPLVEKQIVCSNCGHTVAYVQNDVQSHTSRDISGCSDTDYYIVCPARRCGKDITVYPYGQRGFRVHF